MKDVDRAALDKLLIKLITHQDTASHYNEAKDFDRLHQAQIDRENTRRQIVAFVETIAP